MDNNTKEVATKAIDMVGGAGDTIRDAVAQLAQSLGVAATHVYGVLVRQQVLDGALGLIVCALVILLFVAACIWWRAGYLEWKNGETVKIGYRDEKPFEERTLWTSIGIAALSVVVFVICITVIPTSVKKIYNPEYYAINEVAKMAGIAVRK